MMAMDAATGQFLCGVLGYAAVVLLTIYLVGQVRKPSRWTGQLFAALMNRTHAGLTQWGLSHVAVMADSVILDVGCGGGSTIARLAAMAPQGKVSGIDYAKGSVAVARRRNAASIAEGRVTVQEASVSRLPFADGTFDLVTAIETAYYWTDPVNDMREVRRVLKPGGTFLLVAESYATGRFNWIEWPLMRLLGSRTRGVEEHRQLLSEAGFRDVQNHERPYRGGMCVLGLK